MSSNRKNGGDTGQAKKDPHRRVRKIGQREEKIETKLTQIEIEDMQRENMVLDQEAESLEDKKAEFVKNIGAQLKTIELQKTELRRMVNSGRRSVTVIIEEHLTASNEVIRIRQDTGDQVGVPRTATPRELQEDLPLDKPENDAPQNDAPEGEDMFPDQPFDGDPA